MPEKAKRLAWAAQKAGSGSRDAGVDHPRWDRRELHLSPTGSGMVRIAGDLDLLTGETVLTARRIDARGPGPAVDGGRGGVMRAV